MSDILWCIIPVEWGVIQTTGVVENRGVLLKGYHTRTKKLLHEYGPFEGLTPLKQFAKEHLITLEVGRG